MAVLLLKIVLKIKFNLIFGKTALNFCCLFKWLSQTRIRVDKSLQLRIVTEDKYMIVLEKHLL